MLNWLRQLWNRIVDAVLRTSAHAEETMHQHIDVYSRLEADTLNLMNFIRDLERFHFDPKWNSRVVHVPKAIDGIQEVFDIVVHGLRERFASLYQAILTLKGALHLPPPSPDPQSKLTTVVNIIGQIDSALQHFADAYHQAVDLIGVIDDVKRRIETLDDLFLPQGSTKSTVDIKYRKRNAS